MAERHPLLRLLDYSRRFRGRLLLASLWSVLNKILDLAPPLLIGAAVDVVVARQDSFLARLGLPDVGHQLWALAGLTLAIWGLESVFEYLYAVAWRNLAQDLQHELRMDAYTHLQGLELEFFEDRSSGQLMAVLNDDVNQLERFLNDGANDLLQLVTTVVVIGGLYLAMAPEVAWMAFLPLPFVLWGSLAFQGRLAPRYAGVREKVGSLNAQLANNLGGIATIKSYTAEDHEIARVRAESLAYSEANRRAILFSAAFVPLIRMVIVVGFALILVFGGRMVLSGALNVGVYSVLVFMTQRLLWPMTRLGATLDLYQRSMAASRRVLDLLARQPGMVGGPQPLPEESVRGEVEFDGVGFHYAHRRRPGADPQEVVEGPAPWVFRGLDLRIAAGETLAIVGPTGSGKSSLIKLLLRFYDVQEGRIRLDGHDLRDLRMPDLRRAVGLVSQEVFLFHGTVRENIAYGSFDAPFEAVVEAARAAEAHEFIQALPHGYDTLVGERGQKLSGGQRQRLSLARAVLRDPPVLVLDEATSAVDNETEAAIQRSLERVAQGRTTLVIAHRLSTVRNAHRILVMEEGRITEAGTHGELLERGGTYASLWRVQTGERA